MAQIKKDTSLRKAILQAAITGQLISTVVESVETTETGKQLLDRIIAERNEKALAEWKESLKKNPKAKKPAQIVASLQYDQDGRLLSEVEVPFEIPENWCWCRLSDYLDIRDGTHDSPKFYNEGIPFVTSKNLNDGKLDFSECKYITEEDHKKFSARSFVEDEDILFAMIGSIGNPVMVKKEFDFSFKNMALFKRFSKENTDMRYIFHYLCHIQKELREIATGGVQSFIGLGTFRELLFPLPPLAVQNAIVAKLEQVLPLVDAYENAVLQKDELKNALPDKVKKAILQEAITGKLTENWRKTRPVVEPVETTETGKQLLDRIIADRNEKALAEWKESLKKNPKAKKPLAVVASEIEEDEIPFEVPESWCWCRIDDLFAHNSGKALNKSENKEGTELEYITTSNLYWNYFELSNLKTMLFKDEEIEKCTVKKGDLLVCEGGEVGRSAIWNFDRTVCIQNHIHRLRAYDSKLNVLFYYHVMHLFKESKVIDKYAKGIGIKGLSSNALGSIIVPLPPLEEQEEIVKKVEELLPLCK